jgi:choline dehydrogenase-like flavoprotein
VVPAADVLVVGSGVEGRDSRSLRLHRQLIGSSSEIVGDSRADWPIRYSDLEPYYARAGFRHIPGPFAQVVVTPNPGTAMPGGQINFSAVAQDAAGREVVEVCLVTAVCISSRAFQVGPDVRRERR